MNSAIRFSSFAPLRLLSAAIILAAFAATPTPASARPVIHVAKPAPQDRIKFDPSKFVPEKELTYGEKGYALTVFHGQKIERFDVKILGVLKKVNGGRDLIAFRVTDGPSVSRHANIAHGMSGSPVYIGKRLVGAIAYGLPFGREPIGLITPIGDMLDSWDPDLPKTPSLSAADETKTLQPVTADSTAFASAFGPDAGTALSTANGPVTFEPMMTPIAVSGLSAGNIAELTQRLSPFHLLPVTGGGGSSNAENPTPAQLRAGIKGFVPGAAVAVSLAQGDVDMSAIGTVTYRDGNRVLIFGHPFMGIGPIDAALQTASITDLFPSYEDSIKLGMPGINIGRIFQDRPFSVGGVIGQKPAMIPVDVSVDDESDQRSKTFHTKVIDHPLLTGALVLTVVNEAIFEMHGTPGDAIAYVTTDVDADQVGHIVRNNVYYDPLSINSTAVGDLDSIVRLLSANPFYQLGVKSVDVKVRIVNRHATANIDHIVVPHTIYQPGDTLQVGVVMKPFKQEQVVKTVSLKIPSSVSDGNVILSVRGGAMADSPAISVDASGNVSVRQSSSYDASAPPPANVTQLVKQYLEQPKNNDLVTSLSLPSTAPEVGGEKFSLLPPTMSAIMRSQHASGLKVLRDEIKTVTPVEWVVTGAQQIQITIQKKTGLEDSSNLDASAPTRPAPGAAPVGPVAPAPDGSISSVSVDNDSTSNADLTSDPEAKNNQHLNAGSVTPVPPVPAVPPAPPISISSSADSVPMTDSSQGSSSAITVSRVASVWRQSSQDAFADGTLDGVAVTDAPDVRISPSIDRLASTNSAYVWSQAYDDLGNLFLGTGDDGLVYKIAAGSTKPVLFGRTKELEVTALAFNSATGDLYAGTAPHGMVFKIDSSGKVAKVAAMKDAYVPAVLLSNDKKTLFVSTGGATGDIYSVDLGGANAAPKLLFASPDAHILALAQGPDGSLYAGGNPNGVVYKIDPTSTSGKGKIVFDSPGPTISAIAVASDGSIYAGTAPAGAIYHIAPPTSDAAITPQVAKAVISHTDDFVSGLTIDKTGAVWASAGGTIYRVTPGSPDVVSAFPSDPAVTYTSIAASPLGGVTAGTASVGSIYGSRYGNPGSTKVASADAQTVTGVYTSAIHDARLKSMWGTVAWNATTPQGAQVEIQTRTGDVPDPDATWSDWADTYGAATGAKISSPSARFIQYRAKMTAPVSEVEADSPKLESVSVTYLPQNRPPEVKAIAPFSGEAVSGDVMLRWNGTDPDHDTLQYELYTSSDDGATWQKLDTGKDLRQKPTAVTPGAAAATTLTAHINDQLANHPEIPASVRSQIVQEEAALNALNGVNPAPTASNASLNSPKPIRSYRSSSYTWSTKGLPDGTYRYKVVASDAPSNAEGALTDESVSDPFVVVNSQPQITLDNSQPVADTNGAITVTGTVKTSLVFVKSVQYKLDSGDWMAAQPANGIFDSTLEPFTFTVTPPSAGPHHVVIEAFDRAGNTATQSVDTK